MIELMVMLLMAAFALLTPGREGELTDDIHNAVERSQALQEIRRFFVRREVEVQLVFSGLCLAIAKEHPQFDLVVSWDGHAITAHTDDDNYIAVELEMMFQLHGLDSLIRFERTAGGGAS